jgi:hypothetical protein
VQPAALRTGGSFQNLNRWRRNLYQMDQPVAL